MEKNTISIVTISFNQATFLQAAIDSVRTSQQRRHEYVIVDPGSTDGSLEIIQRNAHRFASISFDPDSGPADGLNRGFSSTHGSVLGYLNADDRFTDGALDYVLDYFDANPSTDILLGCIRIIDGSGRARLRGRVPDRADLTSYAHGVCFFWQQATFFRRAAFSSVVGGFNVKNRESWDGELVVDMILAGCKVAYTDRVLGEFRIHAKSITGRRTELSAYDEAHRHVAAKIFAAGYPEWGKGRRLFAQWAYRLNCARHVGYVLANSRGFPPFGRELKPVSEPR